MPILDASRWDEDEGGEDEDEEDDIEGLQDGEMEKEEEEEDENMLQGEANDNEARLKTGGARWKKKPMPPSADDSITPPPLPTDNPSRPLYPSTLLLGLLHSGTTEDGRVKVSLGRTLRGPLAEYYKEMKEENKTSLASSSHPIVRVPRNVIEKEKKRKRRNKWKKKGKRGKQEGGGVSRRKEE